MEGGFQTVSIALNADSLATWFLEAVRMLAHEDEIFCDLRREGESTHRPWLRSGGGYGCLLPHGLGKSPDVQSTTWVWHATGASQHRNI